MPQKRAGLPPAVAPAAPAREDGFSGQRIVVLPSTVTTQALREPLFAGLLPTDIGWYPAARGHRRERPTGAAEFIFMHCLAGAGRVDLNGASHAVAAGELVAIPALTPHAYAADADHPWSIRWFHLAGHDLPDLISALGLSVAVPRCPLPDDTTFADYFNDALGTLESGYTSAHLLRASRALAHYLARAVWLARHPSEAAPPDARQRVTHCIEHMRRHLDQPLRLAELAALAGWSPSHFKARFRAHTGYGCIDYFIRLRIHAACQLLDTTALDIKTVAARVGYADPLWFSKAFKSVTGQPPSDYRDRAKG